MYKGQIGRGGGKAGIDSEGSFIIDTRHGEIAVLEIQIPHHGDNRQKLRFESQRAFIVPDGSVGLAQPLARLAKS